MELAVRPYHRRVAVFRLEEAIHQFAHQNHEPAFEEDTHDPSGFTLPRTLLCLELRYSICGSCETARGASDENDALPSLLMSLVKCPLTATTSSEGYG